MVDAECDDESNISKTPNVEQLEPKESLNTEEVSATKLDSQSDSSFSENEFEFQNLSGQSKTLAYKYSPTFFVKSNDQVENSNIIRRSFRNSYHG